MNYLVTSLLLKKSTIQPICPRLRERHNPNALPKSRKKCRKTRKIDQNNKLQRRLMHSHIICSFCPTEQMVELAVGRNTPKHAKKCIGKCKTKIKYMNNQTGLMLGELRELMAETIEEAYLAEIRICLSKMMCST